MQKTCCECNRDFFIPEHDLNFLDKVSPVVAGAKFSLPSPTLCPDCRCQRRLAYRNEHSLHYRRCSLTGKNILSMFPSDVPFPVYDVTAWFGDGWDPLHYGREFDFSRPFFEQFYALSQEVPHFNLFINPQFDENAEYTNCSGYCKNCYMVTQSAYNEGCFYSRGITNCKDCADCFRVDHCELCYEGVNLEYCYQCLYAQDCNNCVECYFSSELRGCKYCIGCHSLAQKEYCLFNKQVSRAEWEEFRSKLILTPSLIDQLINESEELRAKTPRPASHQISCEGVSGDHVSNSKNCQYVFDSLDLEECAYCFEVNVGAKDCYDLNFPGDKAELLYECMLCATNAYRCLFCSQCWVNVMELIYCDSCTPSVKNCFGCFGLKKESYCILNKRYSKEEYERLVPRIITHMQQTGEWGEFFPMQYSPFAYNETIAFEYYPLEKREAESKGLRWRNLGIQTGLPKQMESAPQIPIGQIEDAISQRTFQCKATGRPYKIILPELNLYRKLGVPLPQAAPATRHLSRTQKRTPRRLWSRSCDKCQREIESSYAPGRNEIVYCNECYRSQVY